jgi:hypothetical protein
VKRHWNFGITHNDAFDVIDAFWQGYVEIGRIIRTIRFIGRQVFGTVLVAVFGVDVDEFAFGMARDVGHDHMTPVLLDFWF